jgi:acyl-lipid omega-6 desaturase (Delta-12 desaturase)
MQRFKEETSLEAEIYEHNKKYEGKSWFKSLSISSLTLFGLLLCFKYISVWIIPVMALLFVKLFILMHDMGHCIFYPNRTLNNLVGTIFATIMTVSFSHWKQSHRIHHMHSNNLDKPQVAQTAPLDIERFNKLSKQNQVIYWLLFGKYTLFSTTPFVYFVFVQRYEANALENILFLVYSLLVYSYNSWYGLSCVLLSYYFAGLLGSAIFHIQHTFENGYKQTNDKWSSFDNGYYGSSFMQTPWLLSWFLNGIEYHHIHHISPYIPCYNLAACHNESKGLYNDVPKTYLTDVFKTYDFNVYDYNKKTYIDIFH